jgi:hypothetical protein
VSAVSDQAHIVNVASDASLASSEETVDKVETAAEMNEDPALAEVLEDAAIAADATATRVGWLRSLLKRLWPQPAA